METLLHYVWKHKSYANCLLKTVDGQNVEIIDPGLPNFHAGPDFFNAKIKIGPRLWAGNVEIHVRSSDWYQHHHEKNKSYNSVILHVVEIPDKIEIFDENGRSIPQLVLPVPEFIRQNYAYLQRKDGIFPPCAERILEVPDVYIMDWKNALLLERLERKAQFISHLLDIFNGNWNEVFYVVLARNFGFGINNDAFERLAKSLPFKYILKHKDSILQTEALFFGQAGLLEEETDDEYWLSLRKEYRFLSKKYQLKPVEGHLFKNLRMRPNNFPHIKIAQLATFTRSNETLFSKVMEISDLCELRKQFTLELPEYWLTHYRFGKQSSPKKKILGLSAVNLILINTVTPLLIIYGRKKQQQHLVERAIRILEQLTPEHNSITVPFENAGLRIENAADSQAIIQLRQAYCDSRKCIFCRIGHKLLSKQHDYSLSPDKKASPEETDRDAEASYPTV